MTKKGCSHGLLILIVGPSGVGKGTIIAKLKELHPEYLFALSATTRPKRPKEKEGDVYHFLSKERFEQGIQDDEFLEWATVHKDYYYGTYGKPIQDALKAGKVIIREVDVQGFHSIKKKIPIHELLTLFITAPSLGVLQKRILKRCYMDEETLKKRLASAQKELTIANECDYQVLNEEGKIGQTIKTIENIIEKVSKRCTVRE